MDSHELNLLQNDFPKTRSLPDLILVFEQKLFTFQMDGDRIQIL